MHTQVASQSLFRTWSSARRWLTAASIAVVVLAMMNPTLSYAQQTINAQALTPEGIALTAAELGPEWSLADHHSTSLEDGTNLYEAVYTSPAGRGLVLTTAVTSSPEFAEALLTELRYEFENDGMTITSVQSNGFGDGRAFKAQCQCKANLTSVAFLFRVRNLMAAVDYLATTNASDAQTQAVVFARKQESKLFAAFAPPTPAATPTVAPTATPLPTPTPEPVRVTPIASVPAPAAAATAPYCGPAEQPQFHFGFATLSAQLGPRMGKPTSCEYTDPSGSGDTLQTTDTGMAIYRGASDTTTFTNGSEHWALVGSQVMYWAGDSIDPPDSAEPFAG